MHTKEHKSVCPFCDYNHNFASSPSDQGPPEEGDLSLCIECGEFAIFDYNAPDNLRKPTDKEYDEIAANPKAQSARNIWLLFKKDKP